MLEKSGLDVERRGRRRRGGGETVLRGDEHVFLSDTDVNEVEAMFPALKASAGEFIPTKLKDFSHFHLLFNLKTDLISLHQFIIPCL